MWKIFPAWLVGTCFAFNAAAHAQLDTADPPADSTLSVSPATVAITFTEGIEPRFSTIEVRNDKGDRVDGGDPHAISARALGVTLRHLGAGDYTVIWHVLAVDTHRSHGSYIFTIAP
jgi:methionine-rich copper-binding protein CopC